jgi:putative membrane protein
MKSRGSIITTAAALGLAAACAPGPATAPIGVQPSPEFATETLYAETSATFTGSIESARLAMDRAEDPQVREYAERLVDDYTAATQRLDPIMQRHGITQRTGPSVEALQRTHREAAEALRGYEGRDFDQRWIDHQIAMNEWLLSTIDQTYMPAARGRADLETELRTWRTSVQAQLEEARRIRGGLR